MSSQAAPAQGKMSLKQVKITFAVIYFMFMSARAIFSPFITIYLGEKGLSAELIGRVTGINSLVIILSQPFWGIISDKLRSMKKTLVFCIVAQALFAISLIFASDVFLIAICFSIYTTFSSAEGPLLDTWSLKSIKDAGDANAMGQLKLWGCIGYAVCSVIAGFFIRSHSASAIIPVFSIVLLATALGLHLIKTNAVPEKPAKLKELQLGRILKHKEFLIFLAFIFVMQLAHRASYTFYPLLIVQLGGDSSIVGYASAAMFVSQATIMYFSKKMLSRFRPEYLVMASSFSFMLWHLMLRFATSPWHVMLTCVMDGPSFALFTMGTLYYLDYLAPKELRTTYQTVAYSVYFGLSGIVGNVGGGWIIEHMGYKTMYTTGIALTFAATAVFFLINRGKARREASA
ncbi:MFS transporter [Ruminococcaceae bacterium OttesenSCG-928-L11]|nr:MFS transporter [Ruminococcaceae bacterium OttesenSCG-928-L11]